MLTGDTTVTGGDAFLNKNRWENQSVFCPEDFLKLYLNEYIVIFSDYNSTILFLKMLKCGVAAVVQGDL